jgi:hypothetical protein
MEALVLGAFGTGVSLLGLVVLVILILIILKIFHII